MTTVVSKNKQGSTCIRLMIKLKPNYTKDKDGWALCDNADEIINGFIHERNHIDRAKAMGYEKWRKLNNSNPYGIEESAVNAQKSHESWFGCSRKFQTGVENYLNTFNKDEK